MESRNWGGFEVENGTKDVMKRGIKIRMKIVTGIEIRGHQNRKRDWGRKRDQNLSLFKPRPAEVQRKSVREKLSVKVNAERRYNESLKWKLRLLFDVSGERRVTAIIISQSSVVPSFLVNYYQGQSGREKRIARHGASATQLADGRRGALYDHAGPLVGGQGPFRRLVLCC
ncbi:hypothetical protein EVAR_22735_1 [Eumeta japonica]|uniref:Uncharacterized protein n=1 Tax=Eumeta variegata TaxID=151549 RepID=A0A4C1USB2_EUMVA|nr:hypothetical protein EVAR_22735_1 [Eumeta japonica]